MTDYLIRDGRPSLAYNDMPGKGPIIVFLPGYMSDMQGGKALALEAWAKKRGQAFLRFDYSGCGESEGVFAEETLASWHQDVVDLIDTVTSGPLILVGSSMGGWQMLLAARARPDRVMGLVGIAAAPDFTDWGFDEDQRRILTQDGLLVENSPYSPTPTITTLPLWKSGQDLLLLDGEIPFEGPVRLLHGLDDADVPPSIAFRLGRALRSSDVQTILVKGGDHRLSRPQDLDLLVRTVASLIETPSLIENYVILPFLLAVAATGTPQSLAKLPGDDTARFNACVALTKSDVPRAVREAGEWAKQAENLPARHCLGLAQAAAENWSAAATTFVRAATAAESTNDPRAGLLWTQAGNAALAGEDPNLARTALDRALKLPGLTQVMQGEAWLDRGRADVALGDLAAARADIDQGRTLVPDDPFAWLLSATLARRQDDIQRATRDIAEAAKLSPDDAAVALEAGNIAMTAGAEPAAKLAWERAKTLAPNEPAGQAAAEQLARLAAEPSSPAK